MLVTPGLAAVGVEATQEQRRVALARRASEPWYPATLAALDEIFTGNLSMRAFRVDDPEAFRAVVGAFLG